MELLFQGFVDRSIPTPERSLADGHEYGSRKRLANLRHADRYTPAVFYMARAVVHHGGHAEK